MLEGSDIPTWKVPAKPWTKITDDDDFVSHLISLWFTWYHPYFNWIDRDMFIRDMQLGNPQTAKYCSQFLVNIILADACVWRPPFNMSTPPSNDQIRPIQTIQKLIQMQMIDLQKEFTFTRKPNAYMKKRKDGSHWRLFKGCVCSGLGEYAYLVSLDRNAYFISVQHQ